MPAPLPRNQREAIAQDIRAGMGRNAVARKHGVSAGTVTKIARTKGLFFERCTQTAVASRARSIDCAAARVDREEALLQQYLALPRTFRLRDGRETRAARRLSYKLYDINRHHSRPWRPTT